VAYDLGKNVRMLHCADLLQSEQADGGGGLSLLTAAVSDARLSDSMIAIGKRAKDDAVGNVVTVLKCVCTGCLCNGQTDSSMCWIVLTRRSGSWICCCHGFSPFCTDSLDALSCCAIWTILSICSCRG
jgi:hypothetical protein